MGAYSFLNVQATVAGIGGLVDIANGVAEEGIKITPAEDKNIMHIGADGAGQHSLIANRGGTLTITLLKTNPINAILQAMYNIQSVSASAWGKNIVTIRDDARGDFLIATQVAFKKQPEINYKKEAETNVWEFDAIDIAYLLGFGG